MRLWKAMGKTEANLEAWWHPRFWYLRPVSTGREFLCLCLPDVPCGNPCRVKEVIQLFSLQLTANMRIYISKEASYVLFVFILPVCLSVCLSVYQQFWWLVHGRQAPCPQTKPLLLLVTDHMLDSELVSWAPGWGWLQELTGWQDGAGNQDVSNHRSMFWSTEM